jgi:hypothetical protein
MTQLTCRAQLLIWCSAWRIKSSGGITLGARRGVHEAAAEACARRADLHACGVRRPEDARRSDCSTSGECPRLPGLPARVAAQALRSHSVVGCGSTVLAVAGAGVAGVTRAARTGFATAGGC